MAKQCRTPYWSPHLNTVDECRNSATRTCSQCRATLCWQHIKQRCPSGKRNRYGVMQHLTRPHAEELRMANRLTMRSIRAVKETHSHDSALVVITFSYLNGEGLERQFQAYPGAIRQAEGEYQWIPGRRPEPVAGQDDQGPNHGLGRTGRLRQRVARDHQRSCLSIIIQSLCAAVCRCPAIPSYQMESDFVRPSVRRSVWISVQWADCEADWMAVRSEDAFLPTTDGLVVPL